MGNNTEDYSDDDILNDDILDISDEDILDDDYADGSYSDEDYSDDDYADSSYSDEDYADGSYSDDDIFDEDDDDEDDEYDGNGGKRGTKASDVVRYIIIAAAVVVFAVSVYMLADIFLEYKKGVDIYNNIAGSVLMPAEKSTGGGSNPDDSGEELAFVYDHESLLAINPEGQGYLYIPSIDLRLPVVQGTDNDYYLNHTFNKIYNGAGALFVDSRIENGIMGSNVIIYGHNMRNGSMFAKLLNYRSESFYRQPGNDLFYIYVEDKVRIYRIFAAFENDPQGYVYTCNFGNAQQLQEYAANVKAYSLYDTGVDVSRAEQVVTFSTCTSDGERRVIVQGVYIGERSNSQID